MADFYEYGGYNDFNRFINIDGIECKILQHLLTSKTKYAEIFWKLLKYNTNRALLEDPLTDDEKISLVDGFAINPNEANPNDSSTTVKPIAGGQTAKTRLFFSPFVDDAWTEECASVYIFVDDIYPIDHLRSTISVSAETVIHSKVNVLLGDADSIANPKGTNPNDYYYKEENWAAVQYKSRATVLLKCLLAELNGLYIDGVGYLGFVSQRPIEGDRVQGKATLSLFNNRSFFGHSIRFNVSMSGVSDDPEGGF